jgi:cytochrome c oxidase assembly protein subunit 19
MSEYLTCLKKARGMNDQCRGVAKSYLECRMQHNLMAPDEMRNLGFMDEAAAQAAAQAATSEKDGVKSSADGKPVKSSEG